MKSWTTLGLVGGGVLLLIVTGYYFWPRGQLSETQRHVKSEFARPQQVSIHLARTRVELNGVNALQDTPVVLCDTDLPLDVWMPFAKPNERITYALIMVPRSKESADRAFQDWDIAVDRICALNMHTWNDPQKVPYQSDPVRIYLKPDTYSVRYYLRIQELDLEAPQPPVVEYLGPGELEVLACDGDCSKCVQVPLAEGNSIITREQLRKGGVE